MNAERDESSEDIGTDELRDLGTGVGFLDGDGSGCFELLDDGEGGFGWEDGVVDEVVVSRSGELSL